MKSVVSARKKALRKRKQGRSATSAELEINWQGIGSSMDRDGAKCKERYTFLRQSIQEADKGEREREREDDKRVSE